VINWAVAVALATNERERPTQQPRSWPETLWWNHTGPRPSGRKCENAQAFPLL